MPTLQTLAIPAAALATFAGVYAIAPGRSGATPAQAQVQPAPRATSAPGARTGGPAHAATLAPADPLAPAASGQLQCYRPDDRMRTCQSIATYEPIGGNRYSETA